MGEVLVRSSLARVRSGPRMRIQLSCARPQHVPSTKLWFGGFNAGINKRGGGCVRFAIIEPNEEEQAEGTLKGAGIEIVWEFPKQA